MTCRLPFTPPSVVMTGTRHAEPEPSRRSACPPWGFAFLARALVRLADERARAARTSDDG